LSNDAYYFKGTLTGTGNSMLTLSILTLFSFNITGTAVHILWV